MATAVAEEPETKARSKSRKTKAERAEINRANSLKSTGPRTAAGKEKAKFNPLKHGMTARTVLLPGEDATALAARQQQLVDAFQPRNSVELAVIERMAGDIWKSDRADLAAGRRISSHLRHEPIERLKKENEQAIELGGRLMWQLSFPLPISKRFPIGKLTEPQGPESASHPHHPSRLTLQLEQTVAGCDWLLERWRDLMHRVFGHEMWQTADAYKMVRLMGHHAIDMVDDLSVMSVFLSSLTLLSAPKAGPERVSFDWKSAIIKMLMTFDVENKNGVAAGAAKQCEPFARRLAEVPLARLAPGDERHARAILGSIIEQEMKQIHEMRQRLCEIADADAAEAPARLAFELGPEGDRHRRYALSNEKHVIKRFGDFLKTRCQTIDGTFDRVAVDLEVLLGTDPEMGIFESCQIESDTLAPSRECKAVCDDKFVLRNEAIDEAVPAEIDREALAPSPELEVVCNDDLVLRNEAIDEAVPAEIDREALAPSPELEVVCNDDLVLRNEAIDDCRGQDMENGSAPGLTLSDPDEENGPSDDDAPAVVTEARDNERSETPEGHAAAAGPAAAEQDAGRSDSLAESAVRQGNDDRERGKHGIVGGSLSAQQLRAWRIEQWRRKQKLREIAQAANARDTT